MKLFHLLIVSTVIAVAAPVPVRAQETGAAFVFKGDTGAIASQWDTLKSLQPNPDAQVSWGLVASDKTPETALAIADKYCPQCGGEIQGQIPKTTNPCETSDGSYFVPKVSSFSELGNVIEQIDGNDGHKIASLAIGSIDGPPSQQDNIPSAPTGCW